MPGVSSQNAAARAGRAWNSSRLAATTSGYPACERHAVRMRHISVATSGVDETLELARHAELGALALEQRFEGGGVLHAFVDFHVGRRIVAPVHPAAPHAGL